MSGGWAGLAAACMAAAVVVAAPMPVAAAEGQSNPSLPAGSSTSAPQVRPAPALVDPSPPMLGFDTCEAPSVEEMRAWKAASPFSAVGIYIGGAARHCANQALDSPGWVRAVTAQGWRLIPTYVGLQAPCSDFNARMDPALAFLQGSEAASDAGARAQRAGIATGAPIYFDLESFPSPDSTCLVAVRAFVSSWVQRLHDLGYVAGLYGNLNSGIAAIASMVDTPGAVLVDALWIAAWSGNWRLQGFDFLLDGLWSGAQRIHQYLGAHDETWGGVTLNIDSNLVNGPVYPTDGMVAASQGSD